MRFQIRKASDGLVSDNPPCDSAVREGEWWYVEIPDLAALLAVAEKAKESLIVGPVFGGDGWEIQIYDDWVE